MCDYSTFVEVSLCVLVLLAIGFGMTAARWKKDFGEWAGFMAVMMTCTLVFAVVWACVHAYNLYGQEAKWRHADAETVKKLLNGR